MVGTIGVQWKWLGNASTNRFTEWAQTQTHTHTRANVFRLCETSDDAIDKRTDERRVKTQRSKIKSAFGCAEHNNNVRQWRRNGIAMSDDQRPTLESRSRDTFSIFLQFKRLKKAERDWRTSNSFSRYFMNTHSSSLRQFLQFFFFFLLFLDLRLVP